MTRPADWGDSRATISGQRLVGISQPEQAYTEQKPDKHHMFYIGHQIENSPQKLSYCHHMVDFFVTHS
ncbi:MAG: hypothetical protein CMH54_04755 [Myxococcales bacterium]|nr:hypothetical protein [Myxococcales bacterium]